MLTISSGPRLMADRTEFEKSTVELPGEGRTYSTKEEGTKIWKNKTLRKYHEPVPKHERHRDRHDTRHSAIEAYPDNPAIEYRSDRSDISDGFRSLYRNHRAVSATDDQKLVTADDLDKIFLEKDPKGLIELQNSESYSYIPTVRDVGIQCNRKKSNRYLSLNTSSDSNDGVRVIRSSIDGHVSAYSDVPLLKTEKTSKRTPVSKHEVWDDRDSYNSEAIYSKVDKSKKRSVQRDKSRERESLDPRDTYPHVIYRAPLNERRSPSGLSHHSRYSGSEYSTNNRTLKNKTKELGFTFRTGVDGPTVDLPPTSPKLRSRSLSRTRYEEPSDRWNDSLARSQSKREVKQEVLEETISISNASSDDLESYGGPDRSFDEFLENKSRFKEIDRKRKDISYVDERPNERKVVGRDSSSERSFDYRRGRNHNLIAYPTGSETSYSTLSRFDSKKKDLKPVEFTPPPRQAYTLDRRHLKEKQKLQSLPAKTNPVGARLHKSTADLTERTKNEDLRGGLANAYKNRVQEKRPSSLNRMSAIKEGRVSPSPSAPVRYLSHSHLNSAGNSLNSSSESDTIQRHRRTFIHDRDPIVMYIPAVSHHNKRAEDEPDRLSGILRPSSRTSKTGSTTSSRKQGKKPPKSSASDLTPSKPREYSSKYSNYSSHRPHNDEELDQVVELKDTKNFGKLKKGKSILSRRHSIPKDTKFPWLAKLKSKVKFKE